VLFLFLAAVIISARISFPLIRLKKAAEKIGEGEFDAGIETRLNNEIGDLTRSFNTMSNKLSEKTSELRKERIRRIRSVIDGQEIERQRLSRELHDGLGQMLIALKLRLENLKTSHECDTTNMISEVKRSFDSTIDEVRRMSNDLMPAVLYEFGISTALRNLVDNIGENASIHTKFRSSGKDDRLDKTVKTYLYRIAQEALINAVKHASATMVDLAIEIREDLVTLTIEDDGIGFDISEESVLTGNGLHNMRERTGLLHGTMEIGPGSGGGTQIRVNIPITKETT
jgi:signal transduction histidine kinase